MADIYSELRTRARNLCQGTHLLDRMVRVRARVLSAEEAIGNPEADDFPLQRGKERMMQAEFESAVGQAFTDQYGDFDGTLNEILNMPLENNFRRALFIATLNALLRYLDEASGTIHCKDEQPVECAVELVKHIREQHGEVKITQVGFQPRMVEHLQSGFALRVLDMDPDNIGRQKFGITVEGPDAAAEAIDWADLLLVTGTTLVNGTVNRFLGSRPVLFYGTTAAGAARLMGWERFCARSR